MNWINVDFELPDDTREVLVSDGLDYAVAFYNKRWVASGNLIVARDQFNQCRIELDYEIICWSEIEHVTAKDLED